ncbi:MAG: hypothetical protein CMD35_01245 [Flavobacteriales bacterium]|nr:hypothetical protein [Flavobacteriales bacterium]
MIKSPPKVIAEIANAHQGSVTEAINLFQSSKDTGVDAIKFQIYSAEELLVPYHQRFNHFKKQAFSENDWNKIFEEIDREDIEIFADVFGLNSLEIAKSKKIDGIKIHSSDLGNIHLLNNIEDYQGKIFISAGGATLPELIDFINPLISLGKAKEIVLMHGFQTYPTPVHESNLVKIFQFKELFKDSVKYGYMDHIDADNELASTIPLSLSTIGIDYIEKHITHNRKKKGIDYYSSFEPSEMSDFMNNLNQVSSSFGDQSIFFTDAEKKYRAQAKKVCVWADDLPKGKTISLNDIQMKRVESEKPSLDFKHIIGKKLSRSVKCDEQIFKDQIEQKTLAIVVVRSQSSRLPNKALRQIAGDETIVHLLKRLDIAKQKGIVDDIAVCTTTSETDDDLAKLLEGKGYKVYRGDKENVLNRMMLAIESYPDHDIILRITGDDILIDPHYLSLTINEFLISNSDYTDAKNLPSGTEAEIFSRYVLKFIHQNCNDTSGTEYLTNYFKEIEEHFNASSLEVGNDFSNLRLTLDTKEDFDVISSLLDHFSASGIQYEYSLDDIAKYFSNNPEKSLINSTIQQRAIPKKFDTSVNWSSILENPLVSVYITCFNYADYVGEAIHSVLNQSFQDYELLIIDDGSTDRSREIIEQFKTHPKVQIIFQKNLGLNKTNNVAISRSSGKYIMRLDADDYLDPNALHFMVKKMEEMPDAALIFPDYYLIDQEGRLIAQERRHNFDTDVEMYDQPAHGACTMFRKAILEDVGMYSEKYDRQDGYEIWNKIAKKYSVTNINIPLFFYRQHEKSLTKNEDKLLQTRSDILSDLNKSSDSKDTIAIIPIRKDATNPPLAIRSFCDQSLIEILIEKLLASSRISTIIITSNDKKVLKYLSGYSSNKVILHQRDESISALNTPIELTILNIFESYMKIIEQNKFVTILNYEYPMMDIRNVENSLNIMQIYDADSSLSVRAVDTNFYKHDGKGLKPISNNKKLRLERDQMFQEMGGIHSFTIDWFQSNQTIESNKSTHLIIDNNSSKKIRSEDDFNSLEYLLQLKK